MAREFKVVTIDGIEFEIGHVGSRKARDIGLRMLDLHGQVLAALGSVSVGDSELMLGGALGRTLVALSACMRHKDFWSEVEEPLFGQVLQGKRQILRDDVYEELFLGHLERETALLKACVEHNCGDFTKAFAGFNEATAALQEMVNRPQPPAGGGSDTSTGTSGVPS